MSEIQKFFNSQREPDRSKVSIFSVNIIFNYISTLNDKVSTTNDTESIINKIEEKTIDFEQYEVYLFSRNGTYICNMKNKNIWSNDDIEDEIEENNIINDNNEDKRSSFNKNNNNNFNSDLIISRIIKGICVSDFKTTKKNEGIHYNTILFNRLKMSIINIPVTNLIALGIFSQETKSSIIRIFLLNMIISFLNYTGDKNDFFKSKKFNDIKSLSKMNYINFTNSLYSKIYGTFLSIPIQIHFSHIIKKIFRRRNLYIKDIYYKNYYLIDLNSNKIVLSLETLHDKNNEKEPVLKTSNQKNLWDELIFHCHNLKNDYIKKNNMTFNGIDYQNFFVKIEYKVTYPRRNFIIKFLPLLNGMCIIHEYIQLKISTFEGDDKKIYNEKNIIYGYDAYDNIFRNSDNRYFENEHFLLKQVHYFLIESLFCSNSSLSYFFVLNRKPKIYFSEEILDIIDNEVNNYLRETNNNMELNPNSYNEIINRIINVLYEEFIQINNNEKIVHKTSNLISNKKFKNDLILKEIESLNKNKSLVITKNETLIFLFNSIQFNKNINPNDITIDLNDERISLLRITQNDHDEFPSPRRSYLIRKKNTPNSIRLSELLAEKTSIKPARDTLKQKKSPLSRDSKFPHDTEVIEEQYTEKTNPMKEEYNDYNYNQNSKSSYNQYNIINTNTTNNDILDKNNIDYNNSNFNDDANGEYNNFDNEPTYENIKLNNVISNNNEDKIISENNYDKGNNEKINDNNNDYDNYKVRNDNIHYNNNNNNEEEINNINEELVKDNEGNNNPSFKFGSSKKKLKKKNINYEVQDFDNNEK